MNSRRGTKRRNEIETKNEEVIALHFSLDYDGCVSPYNLRSDLQSEQLDLGTEICDQSYRIKKSHDQLITWMINKIETLAEPSKEKKIKVYIWIGSNRQSLWHDMTVQYNALNGSGLLGIKGLYNALVEKYRESHPELNVEFKFESYLTADTKGEKEDGENFEKALDFFKVHDAIACIKICCQHFIKLIQRYAACDLSKQDDSFSRAKEKLKKELKKFEKDLEALKNHVEYLKNTEEIKQKIDCLLEELNTLESVKCELSSLIRLFIAHANPMIEASLLLKDKAKKMQLENLKNVLEFFTQSSLPQKMETLDSLLEAFDNVLDIAPSKNNNEENDIFNYKFSSCFSDDSKFSLVWTQMQKAVAKNPDATTKFILIDDLSKMLKALWNAINTYPDVIPKNVSFFVQHYDDNTLLDMDEKYKEGITGKGEGIHSNPAQGLILFNQLYQSGFNQNIIALLKDKNNRLLETFLEIQGNNAPSSSYATAKDTFFNTSSRDTTSSSTHQYENPTI